MRTAEELNEIDRSVKRRYKGKRVLTQEKTGLTLDEPERGFSQDAVVRRLAYEICGMSYSSPQYNVVLLQDEINSRAGKEMVKEATYSATKKRIYFRFNCVSHTDFQTTEPIDANHFLNRFGIT